MNELSNLKELPSTQLHIKAVIQLADDVHQWKFSMQVNLECNSYMAQDFNALLQMKQLF